MTDFDFDVMQKKGIASGAFHRKRGSRSKKCTMPSDLLTTSQRNKLNGDVIVFSMNAPARWSDFRQLSPTTQKEYLAMLGEKYHASGARIAQMMGVSYQNFVRHCRSIGFPMSGTHVGKMSREQLAVWEEFVGRLSSGDAVSATPPDEPTETPETCAVACEDFTRPSISAFTMDFKGRIDPDGIANSIRSLMRANGTCTGSVRIICRIDGPDGKNTVDWEF